MSEMTPGPRRYTDAEVRKLLERAAELQQAEPASESTGLTLAQLEAVAREAGISVDAVRRAASELEVGTRPEGWSTALAGAPTRVVLERTLPTTLDTDALEAAIPLIQSAADAPGNASLVGHTLTWQAQGPNAARDLQVMIARRDGETRIRIEERYGNLAGSLFGGVVGGAGGGIGFGVGMGVGAAIGSTVMMVGFPIAVIGLAYFGSRAVYSSIVEKREAVLARLMADLSDAILLHADSNRLEPPRADKGRPGDSGEAPAWPDDRDPDRATDPGA